MDENLEAAARGIFARAKAIIVAPKDEWPKIAAETTTQNEILMKYVLPLAAIGPLASFIGGQVFSTGPFGYGRPSLIGSLIGAIIAYGITIVGVFLLSFIADFLAAKFGGQSNRLNAFKLVAYSATAIWASQIFRLIPQLGFFSVLGFYVIYLFYLGATSLMKVPEDKAGGYVAVTFLCTLVGGFALSLIITPITLLFAVGGMTSITGNTDTGGKFTVPGGGNFDTSRLDAINSQLEGAANGKVQPADPAKMQALLPASIGYYRRTATESTGMGVIGEADGTYTAGDNSFHLKITDMSAMGAIAGIGVAMGVSKSREDANGYERTGTVNGQMQSESWNRSNNSGKFSVVVENRFMIEAQGKVASVDELKEAVAAVDQGSLLSLAG